MILLSRALVRYLLRPLRLLLIGLIYSEGPLRYPGAWLMWGFLVIQGGFLVIQRGFLVIQGGDTGSGGLRSMLLFMLAITGGCFGLNTSLSTM